MSFLTAISNLAIILVGPQAYIFSGAPKVLVGM